MTATAGRSDSAAARRERRSRGLWLKRFLPRTLFGRSLLIIVTPVILAQAVATWIFYDRHWDTVTNRSIRGYERRGNDETMSGL